MDAKSLSSQTPAKTRVSRRLTLALALMAIAATNLGYAQDAKDRAGEIKQWREYCNDPDPDLRTAYVEEAIETKGTIIKRICVRLALESTDDDVRNLGLRAAIAMQEELMFQVEMPAELATSLSKAGNDKAKLQTIERSDAMEVYQVIKNGLAFAISDAEVTTDRSTWRPYGKLATPNDNYQGPASIVGDSISWIGNAYLTSGLTCRLTAEVANGGVLQGALQCDSMMAFPISAKLL